MSIDYAYLEKVKPDIVITEFAERFLMSCPNDQLNIVSFSNERLKNYINVKNENL